MKDNNRIFKKILGLAFTYALIVVSTFLNFSSASAATAARRMENLGRGVVAVRSGSSVFISWRALALDAYGTGFNVYRSTAGGTAVKLNSSVLTAGTNYTDTTAVLTKSNAYYVKPVVSGTEQAASASFTLAANPLDEPCFVVPIKAGAEIGNVWVGDVDGDHEYDYILSRRPGTTAAGLTTTTNTIEGYKRDGTFLWSVNLGPNSTNQYHIEPGSTAIDTGMWDGVNVYDLDGNGKAEVVLRIANGVTFGDGTVWSTTNSDDKQWLAVLDGMTGKLKNYCTIPDDYISAGPLALQLGIGYLNGTTPSIVCFMKNRNDDTTFNCMVGAFHYTGANLVMDWKWIRGSQGCSDGHAMRIIDLDGDGKDEICEIGFVLNGDGTLRYSLASKNIGHGDRYYIGKFDPNRAGLQGYGIQQDNEAGILEYYYDATTGSMIWQHTTTPPAGDVGRGDVGDIDPRYSGFETWSFSGVYNGPSNTQITKTSDASPWPALRLWWDGDLLSESLNDTKLEKWDYSTSSVSRLVTTYKYHSATLNYMSKPVFYGDILGDWREEIIMPCDTDYSKLIIFTTNQATSTRLYTLAQNPAYRNSMTIKGYLQSLLPDYFLGTGMSTPPTPNIYLAP